jgi:hypothetical protein
MLITFIDEMSTNTSITLPSKEIMQVQLEEVTREYPYMYEKYIPYLYKYENKTLTVEEIAMMFTFGNDNFLSKLGYTDQSPGQQSSYNQVVASTMMFLDMLVPKMITAILPENPDLATQVIKCYGSCIDE